MEDRSKKLRRLRFATFYCVIALVVLLGLGTWQIFRLQWKSNIIHSVEAQVALPPLELSDAKIIDPKEWQYRRVTVKGNFLHNKEAQLYTGPKVINGEIGYNLLTPLRMDNGVIVLIDRGWVPYTKKDQALRLDTLPLKEVELVGMLHPGEKPGLFTPNNDPKKHIWFWIDIPHMLEGVEGKQVITDYYVRALKQGNTQAIPIAGDTIIHHRNDHLQYAITWYSLAVILIIVYGAFRRQVMCHNS